MRSERLVLTGDPVAMADELRALVPSPESVRATVAEIIERTRAGGDVAIGEYTRRFDTAGGGLRALRVSEDELEQAATRLEPAVRSGLTLAIEHVGRVAATAVGTELRSEVDFARHSVRLRTTPVARAGVYVPGGRAPYPSTVVMGVVTARSAGVEQVAVCSPPAGDGEIDGAVLAACKLTGASDVYRMGGAQAIAALAYGSESVTAVDVIVGPGNLYVQEAKRQVLGRVGIDGFAGPSDLLVIADPDADPLPLALDLLAQVEHGPGTLVIAVSTAPDLLDQLAAVLDDAAETGALARLVEVGNPGQALGLAEAFAPEHLQLVGPRSEALAEHVSRAGCLFVGAAAGTAFGDYIAGSNHVLPTGGAARFSSALSPAAFLRSFSEVRVADGTELARAAAPVARAEGFELHARSMEARIRDNGQP